MVQGDLVSRKLLPQEAPSKFFSRISFWCSKKLLISLRRVFSLQEVGFAFVLFWPEISLVLQDRSSLIPITEKR